MKFIKKLFKEHSPYMLVFTALEAILAIVCILAFVYSNSLSYGDSIIYNELGVEKLLESLYSSTFWALILFDLAFIAIFNITSIVYKKIEYSFISICLWFMLLILSINVNNSLKDILFTLLLFIPIIIINVVCYKTEKKKITSKKTRKN